MVQHQNILTEDGNKARMRVVLANRILTGGSHQLEKSLIEEETTLSLFANDLNISPETPREKALKKS